MISIGTLGQVRIAGTAPIDIKVGCVVVVASWRSTAVVLLVVVCPAFRLWGLIRLHLAYICISGWRLRVYLSDIALGGVVDSGSC